MLNEKQYTGYYHTGTQDSAFTIARHLYRLFSSKCVYDYYSFSCYGKNGNNVPYGYDCGDEEIGVDKTETKEDSAIKIQVNPVGNLFEVRIIEYLKLSSCWVKNQYFVQKGMIFVTEDHDDQIFIKCYEDNNLNRDEQGYNFDTKDSFTISKTGMTC